MRDAGWGPMGICVILGGFSLVCGLAAGQAMRLDIPNPLILVAWIAMCVGWYALSLRRTRALMIFKGLRRVLLGNVAHARSLAGLPPASNDDTAEEARVRAAGDL